MKKSKSKKIIIIIAVVIGLALVQLLSYKFALIQLSRPEKGDGYKTFKNVGEVIKIETKADSNTNTKSYLNLIYPVLEGNYQFSKDKSTNRYSTYYYNADDEMETFIGNFKIGTAYTYYDQIIKNSDGNIVKSNKKLFDKYDINNNFDIIEYIAKHYDDKVNIFTDSDSIKMRNLMNTYANKHITKGKLRYIEGDLEGFMIIADDGFTVEVNLKHGDELYYLAFMSSESGKYYNEEKVIEFLSSITFKN